MAELIYFVGPNTPYRSVFQPPLDVGFRAAKHGEARTCLGDLGGRSKDKRTIWITISRARFINVFNLNIFVGQVMHGVSVIPKQTEVRRSCRHRSERFNHQITVNSACWVTVLRNAPHPSNKVILSDQATDCIHIRTIVQHRDGDQTNAKSFAESEVTIISRNRAEKCHCLLFLLPRTSRSRDSAAHGEGETVVHQRKA
ncbi:hypothetical protein D3C84_839330 [compost metagenome]